MAGNAFERYLLLERSGNGKSNSSVFEMRLHGRKLHIRHGNKGQKLAKKIYKKQSISEAIALFSDKRKQKMNDGYRIMKEENKNKSKNESLTPALPISGKSIANPNNAQKNKSNANHNQNVQKLAKIRQQLKQLNVTNVPPPHSDEESSISQGRLKRGHPLRQNKHRKNKQKHKMKQKHAKGKRQNHKRHKPKQPQKQQEQPRAPPVKAPPTDTESSGTATASVLSIENQENHAQTANGRHVLTNGGPYQGESEFNSAINSENDDESSDEEEQEESSASSPSPSSSSSSSSSVQSGRSSDNEYEMDYEKMSHVMNDALNAEIGRSDELEWKPLKVWIRSNEYHDTRAEYATAPQVERIAGSCHELMVVYMRSQSFEHEANIIYKRLLKLARDPEEDNKHHFDTERHVSQYLSRMALMINNSFVSRSDVCIWPVETVQFEYNGELKWATIQPPFLPKPCTNNVFVKIEPNSGKPCVMDATVGRYQHLFASVTRGLDLIRDWQGYGVSQQVFLDVCRRFHCEKAAISQIKVRKNERLQKQTQVLVVIDPVLTTYNAHYETNNPTDFGVKAMDEWKAHHDCIRCRCKCFHLLSTQCTNENSDGMQFGIADIDQAFFNKNTIPTHIFNEIAKCRYDLNIWCGDDYFDDIEDKDNNDNNNNDTPQ